MFYAQSTITVKSGRLDESQEWLNGTGKKGGGIVCFAIEMPQHAAVFGDLADTFIRSLLSAGHAFKRIDIVFDRSYETSIKSGTRKRGAKVPSHSKE